MDNLKDLTIASLLGLGFEYKRIELLSVEAFDEAEKLLDNDWKVISSGLYTILLERRRI